MSVFKVALIAAALAIPVYANAQAEACPGSEKEHKELSKVTVADAAALLKKGEIIMVDANGESTRKKLGVVPGARLLSSYDKFAESELKAKKSDTLVFYCYNEMCSAAPTAAMAAQAKGFKSMVMDAGIMGWKKAGHKVAKI